MGFLVCGPEVSFKRWVVSFVFCKLGVVFPSFLFLQCFGNDPIKKVVSIASIDCVLIMIR